MALTGGPPVRGTKLSAWQIPNDEKIYMENSAKLTEVAKDVREGLLETVGVDSEFSSSGERSSMILKLSAETNTKVVAEAIALENADAWCDELGQVHLGISPFFSVKDVDQSVLSAIKVIHVLLGLHAVCEVKPPTFTQKFLQAFTDILKLKKEL